MSEPTKKIVRMVVDRDKCIGAASCVVTYPGVFKLDADQKAVFITKDGIETSGPVNRTDLSVNVVDDEMLLLAAQSCPTLAIYLFDEEGKQVYP